MTDRDFLDMLRRLIEAVRDENVGQNEKIADFGTRIKVLEELGKTDRAAFVQKLNEHTRLLARIQKALPNEREAARAEKDAAKIEQTVTENAEFRKKATIIISFILSAGGAIWGAVQFLVPILQKKGWL